MLEIDPRSREPIYEQLLNGITDMILHGVLRRDEKLPSVRQMAADLAINPNTIQKAYAILEDRGLIYSRQGRGSFVAMDAKEVGRLRARADFAALDAALERLSDLQVDRETVTDHIKDWYDKKEEKGGDDQ